VAGFKMLTDLRQRWRDAGVGDVGAAHASGLDPSLAAVALALDQHGLHVVKQAVQQG